MDRKSGREGATRKLPVLGEEGSFATPAPLAYPAACIDCPGARLDVVEPLVGATKAECRFVTGSLEGRSLITARWSASFSFGLVRRGVLIRQWVDGAGRATAIDAAGPGCLVTFEGEGESFGGYAAFDSLLCLCPVDTAERELSASSQIGRDLLRLMHMSQRRVARIAHARGRSTSFAKVTTLLCALADTLSPPRRRDRLPVGLQQRDLAKLVGIRHETLCRVLGELEKEALIERDRGGIRILRHAELEAF